MPRRKRIAIPGAVFHAMNRGSRKGLIFNGDADYAAYERLLRRTVELFDIAVLAYCLMPNHWHLVVAPAEGETLSRALHWLSTTHACRWHLQHGTVGQGAVYQGRFKAIPIEADAHFLRVCRYVERNACRAGLVDRAEEWRWCSLWRREHHVETTWLRPWPVPRPADWLLHVNRPQTASELEAIRTAIRRGLPFGTIAWAEQFGRGRSSSRAEIKPSEAA
jgi:putative transposase